MSRNSSYDVAIVGASIAGCTAATILARAGAKVALVERRSNANAFKRICTHFIQPSASPTLDRLGLTQTLEKLGARPSGMNIWTRYGWMSYPCDWADGPRDRRPGWNIRRELLDPLLRHLATDTGGVELMLGQRAVEVLRDGTVGRGAARMRGVRLRALDGRERELHATIVVGADGRCSSIARLAGTPEKRKAHNRFGYFAYYRDTPLVTGSSNQIWLQDPDVAYAFPTDSELTLLVCMPHKDRLSEFRAHPEQAMRRTFQQLADAPQLEPDKRVSKILGKIDTPIVFRQGASPGLALVGDAAFEADPVWGVGCGWALQSGEWLADALVPALGGSERDFDAAAEAYARKHRRRLRSHEFFTAQFAKGKPFTLGERLVYRAAARDREVASRVAAVGGRWIAPHEILGPRSLARMLRVNLSPARQPIGLFSSEAERSPALSQLAS
jgi:2-polyprenyl-6-methoxyphenol hydroxylase-like FAD-dependent oxidoreductase